MNRLLLSILLMTSVASAHEGHDTPGVLPIAPHGGKLGEATHKGDHKHKGEEKELFFEAVFQNKQLRVFPLVLGGNNHDSFEVLSPKKALKNVELKIELPRSKKVEKLMAKLDDKMIVATFDPKRNYRFYVHVSAEHDNETKQAKIQIEKK